MDGAMAGVPVKPGDVITVDQQTWNDTMNAAQGGDLDDLEGEPDYPRTSSGPQCQAEESGYLDSTDVFCPFIPGPCGSGCPTNRERACLLGDDGERV